MDTADIAIDEETELEKLKRLVCPRPYPKRLQNPYHSRCTAAADGNQQTDSSSSAENTRPVYDLKWLDDLMAKNHKMIDSNREQRERLDELRCQISKVYNNSAVFDFMDAVKERVAENNEIDAINEIKKMKRLLGDNIDQYLQGTWSYGQAKD